MAKKTNIQSGALHTAGCRKNRIFYRSPNNSTINLYNDASGFSLNFVNGVLNNL